MPVRTLDDLDVDGAALGVRVDINSPVDADGGLADDARIRAHRETLAELAERGGRVAVLAHQGRPGGDDFTRLEAHADRLDELLDAPVSYCDGTFSADARDAVDALDAGEVVVLENTRFYSEEYMEFEPERAAETFLVSRLAPALDAYVDDAFATAHRSQPSLVGFPVRLPAYAGRVMARELDVLGNVEDTPEPRVYVVGGAKVPKTMDVIEHGLENGLADTVLTTGAVGNVFLLAAGVNLGAASEAFVRDHGYWDEIGRAADLLGRYPERIELPLDVAVERDGARVDLAKTDLPPGDGEPALDVGPETVAAYREHFADAGTIVLNGPAGVFEDDRFADGSRGLFAAVADSDAYSIVGGGDTAAAIRKFDLDGFDHVSTGGGAALTILTGGSLPAVDALELGADR